MAKLKSSIFQDKRGEESWMSVSDLMAGLMMVFMFIAIAFITSLGQPDEETEPSEDTEAVQDAKDERSEAFASVGQDIKVIEARICDDLKREFKNEQTVKVCESGAGIRIRFDDKLLFESDDDQIKQDDEDFLARFYPRLMDAMWRIKDEIGELRIEGYASSEAQAEEKLDKYLHNAGLSQRRSRSVLDFVLKLPEIRRNKQYADWSIEQVTAHGLSSSNRVEINEANEKDRSKNRRVEFKIETIAEKQAREEIEDAKAERPL